VNERGPGVLVELDERGRASLARLGRHTRYLATVAPDGTIILTPAVVTTLAYLESLHPGIELELTVGTEVARKIDDTYDDDQATWLSRTTVPHNISTQILALVRAAGTDGIAAKDIVKGVEGARASVYNALAILRNTGQVYNSNRRYVLGPNAPKA
jgi:hypothetical protein